MILFIDTASDNAAVELYKGEKVVQTTTLDKQQLSETLLTTIDTMLKNKSATTDDVEAIVCVAGPGHFTSLRIGVVTANTLAHTLNIPLYSKELEDQRSPVTIVKTEKAVQAITPLYTQDAIE